MAANAALAIALLGLGQGVARAGGAPVFDPFASNPMASLDAGDQSAPALGDLDADGDLDLISGESGGAFRYYRNTGTATVPAYLAQTGALNPANGLTASAGPSRCTLVDLDGDGDLDLVSGSYEGTFSYFRNTGTSTAPAFAVAANPFPGLDVGSTSSPAFGDLDGDGDQDLASGEIGLAYLYFENTGSAVNPLFVQRTGLANPLSALTAPDLSGPALGDADGDGDLDLIAGEGLGAFHFYQNAGTAKRPAFRELLQAANPFRGEQLPGGNQFATATLGDLDGDGDLDAVSGMGDAHFIAFESQVGQFVRSDDVDPVNLNSLGLPTLGPTPTADFDADGDSEIQFAGLVAINTGSRIAPSFALPGLLPGAPPSTHRGVDLDHDGDFDMVSLARLYSNTGGPTNPSFALGSLLYPQSFFAGPDQWVITGETFGDLDRDGDLDAAVGYHFGPAIQTAVHSTSYFENVGSASAPSFVERTGGANPIPDRSTALIGLGDYDGDGDSDASPAFGTVSGDYYENIGVGSPVFVARSLSDRKNPFSKFQQGSLVSRPSGVADMDGDGDPDAFGTQIVSFSPLTNVKFLLENSIVRPSPRYFGPIASSPFTTEDIGEFSSPAAGDLDGDGDPDFVASGTFNDGSIHLFENTGTALLPRIVERVGAANPFTGLNAGSFAYLALGDLDADGDLDLVAGENYGNPLHYFENVGTRKAPAFVERVSALNPVASVVVPRGTPSFGDLDTDGDLDLVVGDFFGTLRYFKNTGTARSPFFAEQTGVANPLSGIDVSPATFAPTTALGDVDLDGDLDLLVGDEAQGQFRFFENTGTATAPAFVARAGPDNPLDAKSVGLNSSPTFVDLDADGDLDVVSGNQSGTFQSYFLPEPSQSLLLTAGLVLLRWLTGRRPLSIRTAPRIPTRPLPRNATRARGASQRRAFRRSI